VSHKKPINEKRNIQHESTEREARYVECGRGRGERCNAESVSGFMRGGRDMDANVMVSGEMKHEDGDRWRINK